MDEFEMIVALEYERDELLRRIEGILEEVRYAKSIVEAHDGSVESYRYAFEYLAKSAGYAGRAACRMLTKEDTEESWRCDQSFCECKTLSEEIIKEFDGA